MNNELTKAKHKLMILEKQNDVMKQMKESIKNELRSVNQKIKENTVLNQYLNEDNDSKDNFIDQIFEQIRILKELKIENKIKDERVRSSIIEFFKEEKDDKEQMISGIEKLETFLNDVKSQIQKLHIPNSLKLVKKNINIEQLQNHNQQLEDLEHQNYQNKFENNSLNNSTTNIRRLSNYKSSTNFFEQKERNTVDPNFRFNHNDLKDLENQEIMNQHLYRNQK